MYHVGVDSHHLILMNLENVIVEVKQGKENKIWRRLRIKVIYRMLLQYIIDAKNL